MPISDAKVCQQFLAFQHGRTNRVDSALTVILCNAPASRECFRTFQPLLVPQFRVFQYQQIEDCSTAFRLSKSCLMQRAVLVLLTVLGDMRATEALAGFFDPDAQSILQRPMVYMGRQAKYLDPRNLCRKGLGEFTAQHAVETIEIRTDMAIRFFAFLILAAQPKGGTAVAFCGHVMQPIKS